MRPFFILQPALHHCGRNRFADALVSRAKRRQSRSQAPEPGARAERVTVGPEYARSPARLLQFDLDGHFGDAQSCGAL